jgi:perosamine synthetase
MTSKASETARVFVQTAKSDLPALDRWVQVGEEEARVVYEMTLRNELSGGTQTVRDFEARWREFIGCEYAITVCNGTAALYSAMFGVGVGPGDEVICPSYTWIGSIASAPFLGARPVFCEIDPKTLLIDPEDVRKRITPRTRAIIAVHLWGNVCDMDALMAVSRETGVPVIEDCSHAHGATWNGRQVGGIGHVGTWSMQGSKPVSAGEAGIIATSDSGIFDRAALLGQVNRIQGVDLTTSKYERYQPYGTGMKFRAHPLSIGIAGVQLSKLDKVNAGRGAWVEAIEKGVADIPFLEPVAVHGGAKRGGYYGFPMHFLPGRCKVEIGQFVAELREEGVNANTNYYPLLHMLPYFAEGFDVFLYNRGPLAGDYPGYKAGDLPVSEMTCANLVFLPVLTDPIGGAAEWVLDRIHRVASRVAK